MEQLRGIDDVAYVRFASVYRSFRDVNEFMHELKGLLEKKDQEPDRGARAVAGGEASEEAPGGDETWDRGTGEGDLSSEHER